MAHGNTHLQQVLEQPKEDTQSYTMNMWKSQYQQNAAAPKLLTSHHLLATRLPHYVKCDSGVMMWTPDVIFPLKQDKIC